MGALTDLPPALVSGWGLWLAGGLGLMLWFRRRSQRPVRSARSQPASAAGISPAVQTVPVEPADRTMRPEPALAPDPFAELQALLDQPDDAAPRA